MSLQGDGNTLALSDLVQVSAINRRTCQIHVLSPHAEGDLFLDQGAVVHAWWGDLVGAEAVYAMLNTPDVGFHVRNDVGADAHTVAAGWQQLVLEAARRSDHGSVPQPRTRSSERWRFDTPPPLSEPQTIVRPQPGPRRVWWMVATALLALSIGIAAAKLFRLRRSLRAAAPAATVVPRSSTDSAAVVDARELTGAADALPTLAEGAPPLPPSAQWAVAPTIVCRLTIGADGRVEQGRIYRSRLDLAAFEDAALAAVEGWRFHPARRGGAPVAVTINWPVSFTAGDAHQRRAVRIKGSDTIGGALAPALGRAFHAAHADVDVSVEALGSKTAFVGLFDGSAELGASSRPVDADELKQAARLGVVLREWVLAYDGVAVIVHPSNPLTSLSLDELAQIFTGRVRDW
ncbi:MAG: TonB family protein, partial [Polyangia bacterium]